MFACVESSGEITSLADFVGQLAAGGFAVGDPPVWYRGCRNEAFALIPSALRPPLGGHSEKAMLKRYMQDAHFLMVEPPASQWEWVFSAQHHGVPTRLLDWTENPLVGLYFASEPTPDPDDVECPGGLWVLNPAGLNAYSLNEKRSDLPMFGIDAELDKFAPLTADAMAVHLKPAAGLAMRSFLRIAAQWGTFTVHANDTALEDVVLEQPIVKKFTVAADAKSQIRNELQTLGIESRSVYPDLHHLGASIRERYAE